MQRLRTRYVRIMSFKPADDAQRTPPVVFERSGKSPALLDAGCSPSRELHEPRRNELQHALELLEQVPGLQWVFDTANPIFNADRSKPKPWPKQDRGNSGPRSAMSPPHPRQGRNVESGEKRR